MAISWLTALKVIPWADVIEAAPHVLKGARSLLARTRGDASAGTAPADDRSPEALTERVARLEAEQAASAELIRSLAEQNAKLVAATGVLRVRTRMLLWTSAALAVAVLGMLVALLAR